ncbi:threonine/serine exporter family protein [Gardnerella vaginalis]|uniref:threonine/serine ThrE exporter family protein n=1 Tax=Gardnerella vaginalis TaxID=2702 RepID=UPI00254AABC3|nr:threonine/serine exporter family protein [Gardnerella vaginalis]MDK7211674.1 threonine/serine exporter family protein [Gardnerella vaginalis]MDK8337192.1 threonine/serine exporter family protein [Gardnerella vaginalis]
MSIEDNNADSSSSNSNSNPQILPTGHIVGKPSGRFQTHAIPLDMEDVERDWDKPVAEAGIAAKSSIIIRVGALGLGAGTGSYRVRELMHRIGEPMGVNVRADVNLTDIEATCTDKHERITEVVDLPTTGVNTERIWLLEHFADWFNVKLGNDSLYHSKAAVSKELVDTLQASSNENAIVQTAKKSEEHAAKVEEKMAIQEAIRKEKPRGIFALQPERTYAEHFSHVQNVKNVQNSQNNLNLDLKNNSASLSNQNPACDSSAPLTVRQVHDRLDLIKNRKPLYKPWFAGLASAVACASFAFLLGGGAYDMLGAFIGAGIGHYVRRRMFMHHLNQFVVTFIAVAVGALSCIASLRLVGCFDPAALHHNTAYIGSVLFVIPGFPLITGGLDIAKIDFPSGIQRLCYTMAIILMGTLAGWMVASLVQLNPQGFTPLGLNPWLNTVLRMITAFAGVWGFSVLFNSPQRMCFVAGIIGAITDTLRLTMADFGIAAEIAAFTGALLAGLLASAWRSVVHRGWAPQYLGYPRIGLTVPSIVIMVPGLYMYRAMFYLGQFNTLPALDWTFRAFMVIICLPLGLAVARVITDKSWRYDI